MKRWMVVLLLAVALLPFVRWLRTELRIDRCLDHGGRWNYQQRVCESGDTK